VQPNRSRSPLNAVCGWKLDLLVRDFARCINSEVALLYRGGKGQPPAVISSWGLGATHEPIARPREGGLVGRALRLTTRRAALEPLDLLLDCSLFGPPEPRVLSADQEASRDGGTFAVTPGSPHVRRRIGLVRPDGQLPLDRSSR
jgi:hypothetical protein